MADSNHSLVLRGYVNPEYLHSLIEIPPKIHTSEFVIYVGVT